MRNRIMAGIAKAVLVIEAEEKSGTRITARLATEYNRDVLALPGSIFSQGSAGPHMLIKLGATPVTSPQDILNVLGFKEEKTGTKRDYSNCTPAEQTILELLAQPMPKDELIRASGLTTSEANTTLSVLEIKGLIKETMGEVRLT